MEPFHLVDLSVALGPNPSEHVPVQVERISHQEGGRHLAELVGVSLAELEGQCGWASERLTAITHTGTHMDAPFHCAPQSRNQPTRTIDQIPLEWCFGPAVCVRVDSDQPPDPVDNGDLFEWEQRVGRRIKAGEIVLFCTGASAMYGSAEYSRHGRALSPSMVRSLASRGVRVIGTDAWSIDPHYEVMREQYLAQDQRPIWAAHKAVVDGEFCIIEKLCNLEALPEAGFWVACFPIKVQSGSAGWVRAVAFVSAMPRTRGTA